MTNLVPTQHEDLTLAPVAAAGALRDTALVPATGSLDAYISSVSSIPMLTGEQERELAADWHQDGDLAAAQKLVFSNLRFVVHIARGYMGYGLPLADLIQEGNVGLMKAVKRFDPEVGVRLISFAVHWVRSEIHEFILRNWRIVKVATTKAQRKLFFNLRSSKKRLGWLSHTEVQAVADDLGVKPETVLEMESRLAGQDVTFEADASDDEEGRPAPSGYLTANPADTDPARLVEAADNEARGLAGLKAALNTLDERSRDIVQRRWLAEAKATLQELANEYGVSAERIRQIEAAAMKKMRAAVAPG